MYRRLSIFLCAAVLMWIPFQGNAFGVSPASIDVTGDRGSILHETFRVINASTAEQTSYFGTLKFASSETSGTPQFIPYDTDHSGLPEWIAFPVPSITVPPRTAVEVPFTITIPIDAPSGTTYGAVTASTAPSDVVAANGASIEATTAVLVFLTVSGETSDRLGLLDFTDTGGTFGSVSRGFAYRVQNQGNVAEVPTGSVTVTDVFGRVVATADANPDGGRVLPGTTRTYEGTIPDALLAMGPLTARLSLTYADQTLTASFTYVACPWKLALVLLLVVVLIAAAALKKHKS